MFDKIFHRWLRVPYSLHVGVDTGPSRPELTIVFIHGLANSHAMWQEIIKKVDTRTVRVLTFDLLGFGASPKPSWLIYNTSSQARALRYTLLTKQISGPVIVVGHSLGALVAVQYASKYPAKVSSLLLCSPPFYKPSKLPQGARVGRITQPDDAYHVLYRNSRHQQELAVRLASFLKSAKLLSKHFTISEATMPAIVSSLEMSIENQTSLDDAKPLTMPTRIIHGQFDAFVIKSHLKELRKKNNNIRLMVIPTGHEINGPIYRTAVTKQLQQLVDSFTKNDALRK